MCFWSHTVWFQNNMMQSWNNTKQFGKTVQIPFFSKMYKPWTAEPFRIFPEHQILFGIFPGAAQIKTYNIIPKQHKKYLTFLRAARNNIPWFYHLTKSANLRPHNTSFQSSTNSLVFSRGGHFVVLSVSQESWSLQ